MFYSFDGIDGVGKTTQMRLFCQWLEERGEHVVTCRDPGSTALGEQVRDLLLQDNERLSICQRSEMLLYMAARAQLVEEVIQPALAAGKTVVSDRYLLANVVYQGYAGGLEVDSVRAVGEIATAGLAPDCTFVLDMPARAARQRLGDELDRIESRGASYRENLRSGFLAEVKHLGKGFYVVDAAREVDEIQAELRQIAEALLESA